MLSLVGRQLRATRPGVTGLVWALGLPTLIAVAASIAALGDPLTPHWQHLWTVVLPMVSRNTLLLMLQVAVIAGFLGTSLAWLTARYDFPARALIHVLLLLPLALPGYVLGFVAIAGLDYAGPVQSVWRAWLGTDAALWQFRSLPGAGLILGITLYPYVYLIARNAFLSISPSMLDMAASLGRKSVFWSLALPLAKPWIGGGLLLVCMEVLADFGTVALFNVPTFTTAIYKSWYGFFDLQGALQLASVLVLSALALMLLHRWSQRAGRMEQDGNNRLPLARLSPLKCGLLSLGLSSFVLVVAGLPIGTLIAWSWTSLAGELDYRYGHWLGRSLLVAGLGALLLTSMAVLMAYLARRQPSPGVLLGERLAGLGYALPGTLIAVGLFAPLATLEQWTAPWLPAGWLTQSLLVLLLGYWARFFSVAHTPIAQQLTRIRPSIDQSAHLQGYTGLRLLGRVHLPLIASTVAGATALVLIDIIKEMPITLMLRPSGFDTLSTRVFELTAEGEYVRAALPALTIVLAGLLPVSLLLRSRPAPSRG